MINCREENICIKRLGRDISEKVANVNIWVLRLL